MSRTEEQWACEACTFLNEAQHLACSMCGCEKPFSPAGEGVRGSHEELVEEVRDATRVGSIIKEIREEKLRRMTPDDFDRLIQKIDEHRADLQSHREWLSLIHI